MALAYPLSLAQFFDTLPVASVTMRPGDARSFSETGGGAQIAAQRGTRLWHGSVRIDLDRHSAISAIEARLALLEEPGASFLVYDRRKPWPSADPGGLGVQSSTVRIASLNANNRELTLKGLPSGYVITAGDLMGWTYGASPLRYALHRVVTGATANGSGVTGSIEVTPFIRQGAAVDAIVSLGKPVCKAQLVQADYGSGRSIVTEGGTFDFIQTLR